MLRHLKIVLCNLTQIFYIVCLYCSLFSSLYVQFPGRSPATKWSVRRGNDKRGSARIDLGDPQGTTTSKLCVCVRVRMLITGDEKLRHIEKLLIGFKKWFKGYCSLKTISFCVRHMHTEEVPTSVALD